MNDCFIVILFCFDIIASFGDLPANQWFAFDECGIDGDFNINAKVVAIKGSKVITLRSERELC